MTVGAHPVRDCAGSVNPESRIPNRVAGSIAHRVRSYGQCSVVFARFDGNAISEPSHDQRRF